MAFRASCLRASVHRGGTELSPVDMPSSVRVLRDASNATAHTPPPWRALWAKAKLHRVQLRHVINRAAKGIVGALSHSFPAFPLPILAVSLSHYDSTSTSPVRSKRAGPPGMRRTQQARASEGDFRRASLRAVGPRLPPGTLAPTNLRQAASHLRAFCRLQTLGMSTKVTPPCVSAKQLLMKWRNKRGILCVRLTPLPLAKWGRPPFASC